jgi:putative exosortase-associated protein (TIGR04073 family)
MNITTRSVRGSLAALAAICAMGTPMVSQADTAMEKAGRGLAAIFTPFLEIPGNIITTTHREGAAAGWTEGLAIGLGKFILRPPIGVYELVTAPIPAPANFEPIMEPEYPWSYFGRGDDTRGVAHR